MLLLHSFAKHILHASGYVALLMTLIDRAFRNDELWQGSVNITAVYAADVVPLINSATSTVRLMMRGETRAQAVRWSLPFTPIVVVLDFLRMRKR